MVAENIIGEKNDSMAKKRDIGDIIVLNDDYVNFSSKKERNIGKKIVLEDKKENLKQKGEILLSAPIVDKGKLKFDANKIAQGSGFLNKSEMKAYKANKGDLFEGMDGVKYIEPGTDLSGAPYEVKYDDDYAKGLSNTKLEEIVNRFNNSNQQEINNIISILNYDVWQDAKTMKRYSDTVIIPFNGRSNVNLARGTRSKQLKVPASR